MGGSSSKTTSAILNQNIANIISSHASRCSSETQVKQNVNIETSGFLSIGSTTKVVQNVRMGVSCLQQVLATNNLSTIISAAIKQAADAKDSGLGLTAGANAANTTLIKNVSETTIDSKSLIETYANISMEQDAVIKKSHTVAIASGASVLQGAELIVKSLQTNTTVSNIVNDAATKLDQNSKSESKNAIADMIDSVGGLFSSFITGAAIYWIGVILLILGVLYIISRTLRGYGGSGDGAFTGSAAYMATFDNPVGGGDDDGY